MISLALTLATVAIEPNHRVDIETSAGTIAVELACDKAPQTSANFLKYVAAGHYKNARFHRTVTMQNQPNNTVKIEVIQAGVGSSFADKDFPPIKLERTSETGLKHLDGTISMARDGADSATSDFFICIGDQPSLDFGGKRNPDGQGFAAFGKVISGMKIVRAIQAMPSKEQSLEPPFEILNIRLTN